MLTLLFYFDLISSQKKIKFDLVLSQKTKSTMEKLYEYQATLLSRVKQSFLRSSYEKINWKQRMFGITGLRGTGKTTMMLQYLKFVAKNNQSSLYVSADYTWFYENSITDLAHKFVKNGGRLLMIDEIHKYPRWSGELKNIYDILPDLQVIFTASSALDILKGESDLSRRAIRYELPGMSFREYLRLIHNMEFPIIF